MPRQAQLYYYYHHHHHRHLPIHSIFLSPTFIMGTLSIVVVVVMEILCCWESNRYAFTILTYQPPSQIPTTPWLYNVANWAWMMMVVVGGCKHLEMW